MMQAADLQKACAIAKDDPGSDLVPTQADFQERVQSLAAQLLQVLITLSSLCLLDLAQSHVTCATLDCLPALDCQLQPDSPALKAGEMTCCHSRSGIHCMTVLVDTFVMRVRDGCCCLYAVSFMLLSCSAMTSLMLQEFQYTGN